MITAFLLIWEGRFLCDDMSSGVPAPDHMVSLSGKKMNPLLKKSGHYINIRRDRIERLTFL